MSRSERTAAFAILAAASAALFAESAWYLHAAHPIPTGVTFLLHFFHVDDGSHYVVRHILTNPYYPPLVFVWHFFAWVFFGTNLVAHVLAANVLFAAGAVCVYLWLRSLNTAPIPASLAAAAYLLLPGVTVYSKTLAIEQPMVLLLPLCLLLIERGDGFARRGASVALGVCVALGILTKWSFAAYMLVPLAMLAWRLVRGGSGVQPGVRWKNLGLAAIAGFLAAAPWYLSVFEPALMASTVANDPTFAEPGYVKQFLHNLAMLRSQTGIGAVFVLAAAFVAALVFGTRRRRALFLAGCIAVPLLLFSWPVHLENRYLLPLLVFLPGVVSLFGAGSRMRRAPLAVAALLLAASVAAHVGSYRGGGPLFDDGSPAAVPTLRLDWRGVKAATIVEAVERDAFVHGIADVQLAVHPLWQNRHCADYAMEFATGARPLEPPIRVNSYGRFNYHEFTRDLKSGRIDYVVLDCADKRVCGGDAEQVTLPPSQRMNEPYIDQRTGTVHEPYSGEDVRSDLRYLFERFTLARTLDLGDAAVNVYRRKAASRRGP